MSDTLLETIPEELEESFILKDIADMKNRDADLIDDIRTWRDMYALNWKPADKRDDIDYSVDPLPVTVVDHATDRITAQEPLIDVPVSQFTLDQNLIRKDDELTRMALMADASRDLPKHMPLNEALPMMEELKKGYKNALSRKQQSFAREKSDKVEHYLLGIWEWNQMERNEGLLRRLTHDLVADGICCARTFWDPDAADGECPIVIQRVDPVCCFWREGPHGTITFCASDNLNYRAGDILRDYGLDVRENNTDSWDTLVQFNDYWTKARVAGKKKYEIWHAIISGGRISGKEYGGAKFIQGPAKTDYTDIPYKVVVARPYENTEDLTRRRSILTGLKIIWEQMNIINTRWSMILKKAAFPDLIAKGTSEELPISEMGKGKSVRTSANSPDVDVKFVVPPDAPNSIHLFRKMLDQQAQMATFPKPIFGDRGGTTSGIQDVTLIQSGLVRLNSYVKGIQYLLQGVFDQVQLRTIEFAKNSDTLTLQVGDCCREIRLGDVKGRYKISVKLKGETPVEELMRGLAFLQYRVGPTPLLSDDYILDKGLGIQYPGEEQEKTLRQSVERHSTLIDFSAEQTRAQLQTQAEMQAKIQTFMLGQQKELMPDIRELELEKAKTQMMLVRLMQAMGATPGASPGDGPNEGGQSGPAAMSPEPEVANRLAALGMVRG